MKNLFAILSIVAILSSCTEKIELELDSTFERLVVEGHITTDTTSHWVRLTHSKDYYSSQPSSLISYAQVELTDGSLSIAF